MSPAYTTDMWENFTITTEIAATLLIAYLLYQGYASFFDTLIMV